MSNSKKPISKEVLVKSIIIIATLAVEIWIIWLLKQPLRLSSFLSWVEILTMAWTIAFISSINTAVNYNKRKNTIIKTLYSLVEIVTVIVIVAWIGSTDAFHARERNRFVAQQVKVITDSEETSAFPNLLGENNDTSNLPLIGLPEAIRRIETEMGKRAALGSQFGILKSEITSQNINGSLMYVVPLEPKSWLQWDDNGNRGYFIIDRNNGNIEFIETSLATTIKAPFGNNAKRILYSYMLNNGINGRVTDISPEIDDSGNFFYVATVYETDGIDGMSRVTGVIQLNPFTTECEFFGLDNIPEYIDRVFPQWLFEDYLEYYGKYEKGWLNSWIKQKGVQVATDGSDIVYIDGTCYYYTGFTPSGKGESSNGIMMMNCRTGEIEYHVTYGISENRAITVAQGKVQEKEYSASYPLLLMISGEETYFMLMRDKNNNLVGYAFVNYKDYTKSAVNESLLTAQADYIKACNEINTADLLNNMDSEGLSSDSGTILQLATEVVDNNTMYYIRIKESGPIYTFRSTLEPEIVFAKEGDTITISYIPLASEASNEIGTTKLIPAVKVKLGGN